MVATFVYLVIRQLSANWQVRVKHQLALIRNRNESLGIGAGIDAMLDNLPRVLKELHEMKLAMQGKGATPEQLKPLQRKIQWAETARQWEPVLRIGAPILNRIGTRTIDRAMQWLERII